jgi:hypothetical protein
MIKPSMDFALHDIRANIILEIISNHPRREMLSIVSEEPESNLMKSKNDLSLLR